MQLLDDWRTLMLLLCIAAFVVLSGVGRPSTDEPAAVAIVRVSDPVDSWIGTGGGADGDLVLARSVVVEAVDVELVPEGLRFEASAVGADRPQRVLAASLASYEAARNELRAGLEERLVVVPGLESFVAARQAGSEGSTDRSGSSTAAAESNVVDDRPPEVQLPEVALAPLWQGTPVAQRLERLDEALDEAFWSAVAVAG